MSGTFALSSLVEKYFIGAAATNNKQIHRKNPKYVWKSKFKMLRCIN